MKTNRIGLLGILLATCITGHIGCDEENGTDTNIGDVANTDNENPESTGQASPQLTCEDLITTAALDGILGMSSSYHNDMPDLLDPIQCQFDYKTSGSGSVSAFHSASAYEDMKNGTIATLGEESIVETNTVGAASFETAMGNGDTFLGSTQVGFLDSTSRFSVLVTIVNGGSNEDMETVKAIAMAVDSNLEGKVSREHL